MWNLKPFFHLGVELFRSWTQDINLIGCLKNGREVQSDLVLTIFDDNVGIVGQAMLLGQDLFRFFRLDDLKFELEKKNNSFDVMESGYKNQICNLTKYYKVRFNTFSLKTSKS